MLDAFSAIQYCEFFLLIIKYGEKSLLISSLLQLKYSWSAAEELIYLGDHILNRISSTGINELIVQVPNSRRHVDLKAGEKNRLVGNQKIEVLLMAEIEIIKFNN